MTFYDICGSNTKSNYDLLSDEKSDKVA